MSNWPNCSCSGLKAFWGTFSSTQGQIWNVLANSGQNRTELTTMIQ